MKAAIDYPTAYGSAIEVAPNIRLLLCKNPSPMTFHGTNTYLLGTHDLAVIDPGPESDDHLRAILASVGQQQTITHIIVTHSHRDHSPLVKRLSDVCGAPIYAYGDAMAGRSKVMTQIAAHGLAGGGEGIDTSFRPDKTLPDGSWLSGSDWQLEVLHTPGHIGNHISLACGDICFTGDHVMGWSSSLVSPPDGDLTDFMTSCARLQSRVWSLFLPGHGAPVTDPSARLDWLVAHRKSREAQILESLAQRPANAAQLAQAIYTETPPALLPAAERNVFAHLVDLHQRNLITATEKLAISTVFARAS